MGDIVSDGTSFSCPLCTGKLKISVPSSPAQGDSKNLANTGNFLFPPPGAQCLLIPNAPAPCAPPSVSVIDPGQSPVEIDGKKALGAGCKLQCAKSGLLTVASSGQSSAQHDGAASGLDLTAIVASAAGTVKTIEQEEAANDEEFEKYKSELRRDMEKPHVKDPELKKIVDKLYREDAKVGSGSTAAAIRQEVTTGQPVGGRQHVQKGKDSIVELNRWLNKNPSATNDKHVAENIVKDLNDALKIK